MCPSLAMDVACLHQAGQVTATAHPRVIPRGNLGCASSLFMYQHCVQVADDSVALLRAISGLTMCSCARFRHERTVSHTPLSSHMHTLSRPTGRSSRRSRAVRLVSPSTVTGRCHTMTHLRVRVFLSMFHGCSPCIRLGVESSVVHFFGGRSTASKQTLARTEHETD